jgi:hypothetical protein
MTKKQFTRERILNMQLRQMEHMARQIEARETKAKHTATRAQWLERQNNSPPDAESRPPSSAASVVVVGGVAPQRERGPPWPRRPSRGGPWGEREREAGERPGEGADRNAPPLQKRREEARGGPARAVATTRRCPPAPVRGGWYEFITTPRHPATSARGPPIAVVGWSPQSTPQMIYVPFAKNTPMFTSKW